jgi:SsrA-binding protein
MRFAEHKRAHFDFEILKQYEAGIALLGSEVKTIRSNRVKLDGGHVIIRGREAFLVGVTINAFQPINTEKSFNPERARKLLLTEKEIAEIERETERQGLTAIPLALYSNSRHIKLALAVARGKKKVDKRESIKARDVKRDIDRTLKNQ